MGDVCIVRIASNPSLGATRSVAHGTRRLRAGDDRLACRTFAVAVAFARRIPHDRIEMAVQRMLDTDGSPTLNRKVFTAEQRVGRLIEVRHTATGTLHDYQMLNATVYALLARMSAAVFCTDMRDVEELPEAFADRLMASYRVANARVLRTAILARANVRAADQLERVVREAGHPSRRVFRTVFEARAWLGEVLDPAERARLDVFLKGSDPTP